MLNTLCSEVVWRVLATHSIRQFPLHFPSRASPYAITLQLDSTTWSDSSKLREETKRVSGSPAEDKRPLNSEHQLTVVASQNRPKILIKPNTKPDQHVPTTPASKMCRSTVTYMNAASQMSTEHKSIACHRHASLASTTATWAFRRCLTERTQATFELLPEFIFDISYSVGKSPTIRRNLLTASSRKNVGWNWKAACSTGTSVTL